MTKNKEQKSEFKSLLWIFIIALIIRTFIFELFYVPTGSMKETILEGDYIFSTKYSYGYSNYSFPFYPNIIEERSMESLPKRGDVVIMQPQENISPTRYIKRLIGIPGDKIQVKQNLIYINDTPIKRENKGVITNEQGKKFIKFLETLPNNVSYYSYKDTTPPNHLHTNDSNFGPYFVPQGHYFFMGDNRDHSGDSRFQLGMVPFKRLIAKAQFVLFSNSTMMFYSEKTYSDQFKRIAKWFISFRLRFFTSMYQSRG